MADVQTFRSSAGAALFNVDDSGNVTAAGGVTATGTVTAASTSVTTQTSALRIESLGSELTIASGAITVTSGWHLVDTQGDASTDDLDTINGGVFGQNLRISPASGSRDVVVKHNTGNIKCPGGTDITLAHDTDMVELIKYGDSWVVTLKRTNA